MEDERSESSDSNIIESDSDLEDSSNSISGDSSSNFFDFDEVCNIIFTLIQRIIF